MNKAIGRLKAALCALAAVFSLAAPALSDDSVHIKTAEDLCRLSESCTLDTWSQGKTVQLDGDISLEGVDFTPIPSFGGVFKGNGHTISGLYISGSYSRAGLFASVQESGVVKNLNVSGTVDMQGSSEAAGGIAGVNEGTILSCSFTGTVSGRVNTGAIVGLNQMLGSVSSCTATGAVYGSKKTGGITGCNLGLVTICKNFAYVNTVSEDKNFSIQDFYIDTTFDLAKLSTHDAGESTSDTGGIAGYSSGILRGCTNEAVVGYQHVGYNIGGIAGRSCGFLSSCVNRGTVYGRKDVGGIVGQMEPYMELNVENSMLARMQKQLDELNELINKAADDAQGGAGGVSSRLNSMAGYVGNAVSEAANVSVTIGGSGQAEGSAEGEGGLDVSVDVPPLDVDIDGGHLESGSVSGGFQIVAAPDLGGLTAAINGIGSQLSLLNGAIVGTTGVVADDVRAINDKFNELSNTMFDAIFTVGSEDSDILVDTSGVDIELVTLGKVSSSTNTGAVSGDINTGGIAGAMAIEYEYDLEDDVSSNLSAQYKREYEMKAVLQNCTNKGAVTARRSYAGGVAGRMDLGVLTGCRGFGDVTSESGDYVGGIAGLTSATIRSCWSKCTLSGGKYIGGVVGSGVSESVTGAGSTVAGCVSMVAIADGSQYLGAVSGADAGDFLENTFVSDTLAGIDGVSVAGKAEPVTYAQLRAMERVPAEMKRLSLRFVADGETLKTLSVNYGDSLGADVYPEIPAREGYYAVWDRTELTDLHFDTVVTAEYRAEFPSAASGDTRGEDRPVLFSEGRYTEEAELTVERAGETAALEDIDRDFAPAEENALTERVPWLSRLEKPVSAVLEEQLCIRLPDDGLAEHTLHYLPPEGRSGELRIYEQQDGRWRRVKTEEFGSYVTFTVAGTQAEIAAVSVTVEWWLWAIPAVLVAAAVVLIVLAARRHARRRREEKARALEELMRRGPAPSPETADGEDPAEAGAEAPSGTAARRKKRKRIRLCVILGVLVLALAAAAVVLVPRVVEKIAPYRALSELAAAPQLSMQIAVDAEIGGETIHTDVPVYTETQGETRITRAELESVPLYYSGGMLILENGKAYGLDGLFPDYSALLDAIAALYRETESTGGGVRLELDGEQVQTLLHTLCPELVENGASIDRAGMETTLSGGEVESIAVSASGRTGDEAFSFDARIGDFDRTAAETLPEKVTAAAARERADTLPEISGDLFRLIAAWSELDGRETTAATLTLAVDCGPVVVRSSLALDSRLVDGRRLYCIGKNGLRLYTDGSRVVGESGLGVTAEESQLADSSRLLQALYRICLDADILASSSGGEYVYTAAMNGDGVAELLEILSPEAAALDAGFSGGTIRLTLADGKITDIAVDCTGSMKVVLVETAVSLSAGLHFTDKAVPDFPAAAVEALTRAE